MKTKVQTAIPRDINGTVHHIDYFAGSNGYLKIIDDDGNKYSAALNRLSNSPGSHRCLIRAGDEITFRINPDDAVVDVKFLTPPEAELAEEEYSIVTTLHNGLIFGERLVPGCHCPLYLGRHHALPQIAVGMVVKHNLGTFNNKSCGTNVLIEWNYETKD